MITAENITDEQICSYRDSLPRGHWQEGVCADALGSTYHPVRRRNCRRMCAEILNQKAAK